MEDSDDSESSAWPAGCADAVSVTFSQSSPSSFNDHLSSPSTSPSSSVSKSFYQPFPASESSSSKIEANVWTTPMHAIRKFASAKRLSMATLKREARKLGLVITKGSRSKNNMNRRIGFGLKKRVRTLAKTFGDFPTTLFMFSNHVDGFFYPGKLRDHAREYG